MLDLVATSRSFWHRHDLLRIAPSAWDAMLVVHPDLTKRPFVKAWASQGWPVMVRRATDGDDPAMIPIGIALPPSVGKLRLALAVPEAAVIGHAAPPALRVAKVAAPVSWQPTIAALIDLGSEYGIDPRSFGSLLWQHETGLSYLSATSDLDLLWSVPDGLDVRGLLNGIATVEQAAPGRIDGEIVFADGSAVHWRELWTAVEEKTAGTVLVKANDGVRLVDIAGLILKLAA